MSGSNLDDSFRAFAESRGLVGSDLDTSWRGIKSRTPDEIARGFGSDYSRLVRVLIDYVSAGDDG
ncbi:hypothetical protein [Microbacterium sp. LWH11-1.2]|uniref:hypothetical protein n=1 Tax=Microbacterium sp. LWH11-1.2 TaxID=3135258 RepID=UPI0031396D2C